MSAVARRWEPLTIFAELALESTRGRLTPQQIAVLTAVLRRTNNKVRACWASAEVLAGVASAGEASTRRTLLLLASVGLLRRFYVQAGGELPNGSSTRDGASVTAWPEEVMNGDTFRELVDALERDGKLPLRDAARRGVKQKGGVILQGDHPGGDPPGGSPGVILQGDHPPSLLLCSASLSCSAISSYLPTSLPLSRTCASAAGAQAVPPQAAADGRRSAPAAPEAERNALRAGVSPSFLEEPSSQVWRRGERVTSEGGAGELAAASGHSERPRDEEHAARAVLAEWARVLFAGIEDPSTAATPERIAVVVAAMRRRPERNTPRHLVRAIHGAAESERNRAVGRRVPESLFGTDKAVDRLALQAPKGGAWRVFEVEGYPGLPPAPTGASEGHSGAAIAVGKSGGVASGGGLNNTEQYDCVAFAGGGRGLVDALARVEQECEPLPHV